MNREGLRTYCLSKRGAVETFPFGNDVAVFKVMGKMFALLSVGGPVNISLKCEPAWAQILRNSYPAVTPGYHLSKEHWNSIACDGSISDSEIFGMIDHSYDLIVKGLKRKDREELSKS